MWNRLLQSLGVENLASGKHIADLGSQIKVVKKCVQSVLQIVRENHASVLKSANAIITIEKSLCLVCESMKEVQTKMKVKERTTDFAELAVSLENCRFCLYSFHIL